jgi:hypothetical protein
MGSGSLKKSAAEVSPKWLHSLSPSLTSSMEVPVEDVSSHLMDLYNNVQQWLISLSFSRPSDGRLIKLLDEAHKSGDQLLYMERVRHWNGRMVSPSHHR